MKGTDLMYLSFAALSWVIPFKSAVLPSLLKVCSRARSVQIPLKFPLERCRLQ